MAAFSLFSILGASCAANIEEDYELVPQKNMLAKYPPEIQNTIDEFYAFCIEIYSDRIPQSIVNDKIAVIRHCDLLDYSGDVIPEMDGYELIEDILWPNGYGNPVE